MNNHIIYALIPYEKRKTNSIHIEGHKHFWNIMRVTLLFLFLNIWGAMAVSYSQTAKLNLELTNGTILDVIKTIERQSEFTFVYNVNEIETNEKVTIHVKDKSIDEILKQVFNTNSLRYKITDRHIVLYHSNDTQQQQQKKQITGTIVDANGEPIIGANIVEKGTSNGTITDMDGNFSLRIENNATLHISYIGYFAQEIASGGKNNFNIALREDTKALEEIVVVGYGTQKRVSVTGSLATTTGNEIASVPTPNVTNTLAGRMPGLVSYNRSGEPGYDDASLLIRGSSTTGDSSPLVVVDGVADRAGGFSRIDAHDIESITILKDASAAIYGSRAANGVILVTTKRGKTEKVTINYNGNIGSSTPTILPEMCTSWEYAELCNEINAGSYSQEAISAFKSGSDPAKYPNIDAFDLLLKNALQTQHNLSASGGNKTVSFYTSLGYQYQDNYYTNSSSNYNQYNLRSNIDINPHDNLKIGVNLAFRQEDRNSPIYGSEDIWRYLIKYNPTVNIWWPGTDYGNNASKQDNFSPATGLDDTMGYTRNKATYFNADLTLHLDMPWITQGLSFDGGAYIDRGDKFYKQFQKVYNLYDKDGEEYVARSQGSNRLNQNMNQILGVTLNARLNYSKIINDIHNLNLFVAYEQYQSRYDYMQGYRQDFVSSAVDELFAGDKTSATNDGTATETARQNYFGRIDYALKERYLLQFNWRYDGSENFPKGNRFGFFPGVSVGWRISEEDFWKNHVSWMDYFKLRASWGQMGNDKVDAFQYITAYTFSAAGILGGASQTGVWLNRTANPNITWEVANTYNIGVEAKFLNSFNFEADLFKTNRNNILATRNAAIPDYAGLSLPDENIGKCSNEGIELLLGYTRNIAKDWRLNVSGNFTYNRSKIKYIDEPSTTLEWQKRTGKSIGTDGSMYLMYEADGIFRTQEELDAYPHLSNAKIGDIRFKDINDDKIINGSDKVRQDKPAIPRIMYGINLNLDYKDWRLSLLFQGAAQVWQYTFMEAGTIGNFTKDFYDNRWTSDNISAKYPRTYNRDATPTGAGDYRNSFWLNDASYLRLKSIELSYMLPKSIINNTPLSNVRLSLSGFNLLTFTGIKNIDPETAENSQGWAAWNTPQSKVVNFGVNITF